MTDLNEQDKALCEIADAMRKRTTVSTAESFIPAMGQRIRELSAQLAEHPTATDWQNRSERAEAECAELRRNHDAFYLATALMAAQRKINALQQHAEALEEAAREVRTYLPLLPTGGLVADRVRQLDAALANWTAWLIDGGRA